MAATSFTTQVLLSGASAVCSGDSREDRSLNPKLPIRKKVNRQQRASRHGASSELNGRFSPEGTKSSAGGPRRVRGLKCRSYRQAPLCQALSFSDLNASNDKSVEVATGAAVSVDADGVVVVSAEGDIVVNPEAVLRSTSGFDTADDSMQDSTLLPSTGTEDRLGVDPTVTGILEIPVVKSADPAPAVPATSATSFPVVLVDLDSNSMPSSDLDAKTEMAFAQLTLPDFAKPQVPTDRPPQDKAAGPGAERLDTPAETEAPWVTGGHASSLESPRHQADIAEAAESFRRLSAEDQALELASSPPMAGLSISGASSSLAGADTIATSTNRAALLQKPGRVGEVELVRWAQDKWDESGAGPRVKSIMGFAGPALGIWLCSPLMSLIDTAVVGTGSSLELAALGPGTIVVDNLSFLYMFLSTATANLIATSFAEQKPAEATAHLQRLLMVALVCGFGMVLFSEFCAGSLISGLAGSNQSIVPAALRYAKIRGLAWPAVLVASVTQSACLALQDSWTPLLCLSIASAINLFGDLFLCRVLNLGIAGAAWATAASQYAACALMLVTLSKNSRLQLGIKVPSTKELMHFVSLAGPIFLSLVAKVGFYTLVTYMATSLGTVSLAAHQVVIGIFAVCAVCAEPLSQTAQAFLPRLCVGKEKNLKEAKALIQTLGAVALVLGMLEAVAAAIISMSTPGLFTSDPAIAQKMASLVVPLSASLLLNPVVLAAEGVLLANRDVSFLAFAMLGNMAVCGGLLLAAGHYRMGLLANWWIVVLFQVARVAQACRRIWSDKGIVRQAELHAA